MPISPGRPRRASPELLQEAAFELFQLRGYRKTSVELIAKTAGFSRATFFNFFSSKAELFWVETDALIASLDETLEERARESDPPPLKTALLDFADGLGASSIPWALQHYRLLEAADDLVASGAGRVLRLNRAFQVYLEERDPESSRDAHAARAAATTALLLTALSAWIDAGVVRGTLAEHLADGLALIGD